MTADLPGDLIPGVPIEMVPIDDLIQHPENPRTHADPLIVESIKATGFYGAVVRQRSTGYLLVGNGRTLAAKVCGLTELPVQTLDLDDSSARRLLLRDNRLSDLGGYDEQALSDMLKELALEDGGLEAAFYSMDDIAELDRKLGLIDRADEDDPDDEEEAYTRRTDSVQYEPTGERPPVADLVNRARTEALIAQINAAHIPDDVRLFLTAAAHRHLVFNYGKVAEFYAHADPVVQGLMEASALVIIDFDDAILHGFTKLSTRLAEIRDAGRAEAAANA